MKLLLLADSEVGLQVTQWLMSNYAGDIALVVTTAENAITNLARESGVATIVFESDDQIAAEVQARQLSIDVGLVVWWPRLIRQPLLGIARHGLINTHPSMLPYNRGKHYNFWALVEGAPFGVSLHFVEAGIDNGDIVAQQSIEYSWEDTGETLFNRAREAMVQLVRDHYPIIRSLEIPRQRQDSALGSFHQARELEAASVFNINEQYTARHLLNVLRARTFAGHPAAWFADDNNEYEVRVDIRRKTR